MSRKLLNASVSTIVRSLRHRASALLALSPLILAAHHASASQQPSVTALVVSTAEVQTSSVPAKTVVTLTATVSAEGASITTGQVSFCNAAAPLCTDVNRLGIAQLTAAGTATFAFVPGVGAHAYTAVFAGNANVAASRSPAQTLSVQPGVAEGALSASSTADIPSYLQAVPASKTGALDLGASNLMLVPGATYTTGQLPNAAVTADFNGDGILDLAITAFDSLGTYVPGSVVILLGKGDGTFTVGTNIVTDIFPAALVSGDFNGDGRVDLAFGSMADGSISILLGNGDGTFAPGVSIPGSFANVGALAVGDVNGDGIEDLILSQPLAQTLRIFLGRGDGTFSQVSETPATGVNPVGVAVGDFNGDGHLDLAICNAFPALGSEAPSSLTILLGKGDGTFTPAPSVPVGVGPESILAADFNGDGKLDLAVLNIGLPTTISMLFGKGDGSFDSSAAQIPLPYLVNFSLGDFNGDGKPDIGGFLAVYQPTSVNQNVYALINNGDGTFASITASDSQIPNAGVAGDFNGDGLSDLAVTGEYGGAAIYLTTKDAPTGDATNTNLTCVPSTLSVDTTSLFTVTVTSASGTPTGTVDFTDNGTALTTVTLVNGAATYTFNARQVGQRDIVATYVPTGSFGASSATCVLTTSGVSTATTLFASPTTAAYGTPINLTATVAITGNIGGRGSATGTVTFYNGSTAISPPEHVATGVATFTTTTLPPGIDDLTCIFNSSGIFASSNCNIVPVTITQSSAAITLTSSSNPAVALTPITFTAQVAPGSGGTIVFGINGQNYTTTPNAAGTSTYTISTLIAGSYLITATWFATPDALGEQASLEQVVTVPVAAPDFSLSGTNTTFKVAKSGTGNLLVASLGTFAGTVVLTCDPPFPQGYTCAIKPSTVSLPLGFSTLATYTLTPAFTVSNQPHARLPRIVIAALFPAGFLCLLGLARRRRSMMRTLLSLALLTVLATAITACGPDHYIPITTGTYPVTFTGIGTNQATATTITHTVTVNVTIAP